MSEYQAIRYWCPVCSEIVNQVIGLEIKCPFCEGGFLVEMGSRNDEDNSMGVELGSVSRFRWLRARRGEEEVSEEEVEIDSRNDEDLTLGIEQERELTPQNSIALIRHHMWLRAQRLRRRGVEEGDEMVRERRRRRRREIVQTINPREGNSSSGANQKRDVIEAMPNVVIEHKLQCSICLDELEIGTEAKEMPCKHKFHSGCIIPWLELHSSCPICRFRMPSTNGEYC